MAQFEQPVIHANDEAEIAVSVDRVTKTYGIWSSPKARLAHPVINLATQILPDSRLSRRLERRSRNMYREFHALLEVSMQIRKGESWGFIGLNGSGKSTLLKIISGNLRPSSGSVTVDGKVAILDYGAGFNGEFTGRENVYLKGTILGLTRRQIDERFESIAAFAEIGDFIEQPVKNYSSGMAARLGFAIMAHVDADIMITDEALAVGDAFFVQKCMAHIRSFLNKGTFLFVSHATNDVLSLCEKAVWLDKGRVRSIGYAKDVVASYMADNDGRLSQAYLDRHKDKLGRASSQDGDLKSPETIVKQPAISVIREAVAPMSFKDCRDSLSRNSAWRNDIVIPRFDFCGISQGIGGVEFIDVHFQDEFGIGLSAFIGGEFVSLRIVCRAQRDISLPIVGFQFLDRLGQVLFAENTYIATEGRPMSFLTGDLFEATFRFQIPLLPVGDFSVRLAVADGLETDAAMLAVKEGALILHSITSGARHGIIGIPMHSISLRLINK